MSVSGSTSVAAVIGSPVRHSLSPAIHNAAFAAAGLDWTLVAFEVAPGRAAAALDAMRVLGIRGLAVTTPHKEDVAAAVDAVDPAAGALRSVNTVHLRDDGSTFGSSTDGAGLVASLRSAGADPAGRGVVVLGAGAAGRAIVDALGRAGAADVVVVNRSPGPAATAAALTAVGRVGEPADIPAADIVVNATTIGMGVASAAALPCDAALLRSHQVVVDIVYHPLATPLLSAAAAAGARPLDGLGMLVHQAVLQQELWTGRRADPAVMRAAAEGELAARRR